MTQELLEKGMEIVREIDMLNSRFGSDNNFNTLINISRYAESGKDEALKKECAEMDKAIQEFIAQQLKQTIGKRLENLEKELAAL